MVSKSPGLILVLAAYCGGAFVLGCAGPYLQPLLPANGPDGGISKGPTDSGSHDLGDGGLPNTADGGSGDGGTPFAAGPCIPGGAGSRYAVMDLGTDRKIDSLNDDGLVVGVETKPNTPLHGFVIDTNSGRQHDLGSNCCHGKMYVAADGSVVGSFRPVEYEYHAFIWTRPGGLADLSLLMHHEPTNDDDAVAVNPSGSIAGTDGYRGAYLFRNGNTEYLGWLPGSYGSGATGLSASNHVVGTLTDGSCFIFKDGKMTALYREDGVCNVFAVNSRGHSVGAEGQGSSYYRGSVWSADGTILFDLGKPIAPIAINESDQIVGTTGTRAILSSEGSYVYLDDLVGGPISFRVASSINNKGQIIASGTCSDQRYHALLLTPLR